MQLAFNADQIFAALADSTRRDIVLRALGGSEGVAELAGYYPMSFAAVQKHIAILERAGLVTKQRTGRRKVVRTNIEALRMSAAFATTVWTPVTCRISPIRSAMPAVAPCRLA